MYKETVGRAVSIAQSRIEGFQDVGDRLVEMAAEIDDLKLQLAGLKVALERVRRESIREVKRFSP